MIVRFAPTFRDQYMGSVAVMLRSPLQLVLLPFFPLAGLAVLVLSLLQHGRLSLIECAIVVMCFAFNPGMLAFNIWLFRLKNRTVEGVLEYTVDESGLGLSSAFVNAHFKWTAIPRIVETKRYFLFFISSQMAHFIPKAAVGDRIDELRRVIAENRVARGR